MAQQWIRFTLIKRPYKDAQGNVLESIEGRLNRPGIDEFAGGGKAYPDFSAVSVLEWYEKGTALLVLIEGEYVAEEEYHPVTLTNEEAQTMKREFFGVEPE